MRAALTAAGRPLPRRLALPLLLLSLLAAPARAAVPVLQSEEAPGFGIIVAEGVAGESAVLRRAGFSSRRLKDGERMGVLTLQAEEHEGSLAPTRLDPALPLGSVAVTYQSVYLELKNYHPIWGPFLTFWGLRGGVTRLSGTVTPPGGAKREFTRDQAAPLWFLALPLALEHPAFLLLAMLDGASAGVALDIVPRRIWLEVQVGAAIVPFYRDASIAIEQPFVLTRALSLTMAF